MLNGACYFVFRISAEAKPPPTDNEVRSEQSSDYSKWRYMLYVTVPLEEVPA